MESFPQIKAKYFNTGRFFYPVSIAVNHVSNRKNSKNHFLKVNIKRKKSISVSDLIALLYRLINNVFLIIS